MSGHIDVDRLVELIRRGDVDGRRAAIREMRGPAWRCPFENLVELAGDGDVRVRCISIEALGRTGDARAVDHLATALFGDDPRAREYAAAGLAGIGAGGTDVLARAARGEGGEDVPARAVSLLALGMGGQAPARDAALDMLREDDWMLRCCAVTVLGISADNSDTEITEQLLEDPDYNVRLAADWALRRLGVERPEVLEKNRKWYREVDHGPWQACPQVGLVGHIIATDCLTPQHADALAGLGFETSRYEQARLRMDRDDPLGGRDDPALILQMLHALGFGFGLGPDWNPYDIVRDLVERKRMFGPIRRTWSTLGGSILRYVPADWPSPT